MSDINSARQNTLLALLPDLDFDLVQPKLAPAFLPKGRVIAEAGELLERVYFLTSGIGSIVATTPLGLRAEVGLFGYDGYIPTSAVAGLQESVYDVLIQADASAVGIAFDEFIMLMETNESFRKIMIRSSEAFSIQLAYSAVSNAVHTVTTRLARWLLMCHDRVVGDDIMLTHEFIAQMMAVRRPTVTTALHDLEGRGMIRSNRSSISVRDRASLEAFANDAYGKPEREYNRLMGLPL